MTRLISFYFLVVFFLYSCTTSTNNNQSLNNKATLTEVKLNYAKGFSIKHGVDYKIITLKNTWKGENKPHQYVLYKKEKPKGFEGAIFIKTPIKSIVCFSLTHIAFLDKLEEINSIKALSGCAYVSNKKVADKIASNQIKETGSSQLVNYELLIDIKPDIIMTFGIDETTNNQLIKFKTLGLNVVLNSEYMENHPLGKAEWIKFVAAFYEKDSLAEVIYNNIETEYNKLVNLTKNVKNKPSIFVGMPWNGTWFLAGGKSFQAQLFLDAGADYIWKQNAETSSFIVSKEVIVENAINADYWVNLNEFNSIQEVVNVDAKLKTFKAIKNGNVYNNNLRVNSAKGNDYWESGVINPHLILADLIKIVHPELIKQKSYYYKKL